MYAGYYVCAFRYNSQLAKALWNGDYAYVVFVIVTHIFTIYFFLTAGSNPGWADEHQDNCEQSFANLET